MAKDKNFTINRSNVTSMIRARDVKIGDVFEREGSLHMMVNVNPLLLTSSSQPAPPPGVVYIAICNLNTGNVFFVLDDEKYIIVKHCEVNYDLGK